MKHAIWRALLGVALCLGQPAVLRRSAEAMDFRRSGHVIYGSGDIVAGDAGRFADLVKAASGRDDEVVLQLSSPGGDASEAILLGKALRTAQISTLVAHDAECLGACALAFLGGTQTFTTGVGVGRVLEFGGRLSFQDVVAQGGDPGTGFIPLAALADYADALRGIDFGALARLAVAGTDQGGVVNRPRDIVALSIGLHGMPAKIPAEWATNACVAVVAKHLSALDDAATRVTEAPVAIPSVTALRRAVISGRDDEGAVARALAALDDSDALDLAFGNPFYLNQRRPILDARSIGLERGAGFYYDSCIAVRSKGMLAVMLLDGVNHRTVFEDVGEERAFLLMAGPQTRLW